MTAISLLTQANWRAEAERFGGNAADRFAPSMRWRLDPARIYRRVARHAVDHVRPATPALAGCVSLAPRGAAAAGLTLGLGITDSAPEPLQ